MTPARQSSLGPDKFGPDKFGHDRFWRDKIAPPPVQRRENERRRPCPTQRLLQSQISSISIRTASAKPLTAYSNITRVKTSELLFVAGQVGLDKDGKAPADFDAQCALVFANIGAALASQGAGLANIVSLTSYLVHSQDIPKFAQYRAREFPRLFSGGAYPPNTSLIIDRLVREDLLVEVAAAAAL